MVAFGEASSNEIAAQRRARWRLIILVTMYGGYLALMLCRNTFIAASPAMIEDPTLDFDKGTYGRKTSPRGGIHHATFNKNHSRLFASFAGQIALRKDWLLARIGI